MVITWTLYVNTFVDDQTNTPKYNITNKKSGTVINQAAASPLQTYIQFPRKERAREPNM
jgi:hypothetical protein